MSIPFAAALTMLVLFAAGLLPTVSLTGVRPVTVVLAPLGGAVVAALAATFFVLAGWTFMAWFVVLAVLLAAVSAVRWAARPAARPWAIGGAGPRGADWWRRQLVWSFGALGAVVAGAVSLRALSAVTVGFDARAVWLLRGGWFLEPHRQAIANLTSADLPLVQTSYPPLVSATASVGRAVTGNDSLRLGVVVVALLNTCALLAAVLAVCDAGRRLAGRLAGGTASPDGGEVVDPRDAQDGRRGTSIVALAPGLVGAAAAVLLVLVAFGITEPFMTNGYADPIWSLAGVGALVYGLQLPGRTVDRGAAALLVLVAGLSKNEGVAVAGALAVLIALRAVVGWWRARRREDDRTGRWWPPVVVLVAELAVIAFWPLVMRHIHARGVSSPSSPIHAWPHRTRATYDGLAPYLHVLVLAVPLAVVAGLVLRTTRRAGGLGIDGWAWTALAAGLVAIGGAFVTGNAAIVVWLEGTVHRVSEFPALAAWWIVAVWAVVGAAAAAEAWLGRRARARARSSVEGGGGARPQVADLRTPVG
jgi:hypothetical protein